MRYVAAYLLATLGGNDNPEAKDIKKILESVGIETEDTRLGKVQSVVYCGFTKTDFEVDIELFYFLNRSSQSSRGKM